MPAHQDINKYLRTARTELLTWLHENLLFPAENMNDSNSWHDLLDPLTNQNSHLKMVG